MSGGYEAWGGASDVIVSFADRLELGALAEDVSLKSADFYKLLIILIVRFGPLLTAGVGVGVGTAQQPTEFVHGMRVMVKCEE